MCYAVGKTMGSTGLPNEDILACAATCCMLLAPELGTTLMKAMAARAHTSWQVAADRQLSRPGL